MSYSYMYWVDWGERPRIERASMNGDSSTRQTLVDGTELYWPNGLTIDLAESRFYWTDVKLRYIQSARLDGSDLRVVVAAGRLPHPVTLTLYDDAIYWSDWQTRAVYVCSKHVSWSRDDDVTPRIVAADVRQLTSLLAFDASRQPHGVYCASIHFTRRCNKPFCVLYSGNIFMLLEF